MADWRAANECAAAVLKEARGSVLSVQRYRSFGRPSCGRRRLLANTGR